MRRFHAALVLAASALLFRVDCSIDSFCEEGADDCVDVGCHDRSQNGDESDVDCGGSCEPCPVDRTCVEPADCGSGRCVASRCCEAPCALWASSFGSLGYDEVESVAIAADGSIYLAGVFSGIVDFGGGPLASAGGKDLFVVKLDADGKHIWSTRFGGTLDDDRVSVAVTAAGHPLLAITSHDADLDLGGGTLQGATDTNLFIVELDTSGKHVWSRSYAGLIDVAQVAIAPNSDIVLTGWFGEADLGAAGHIVSAGSSDVLLARFDASGEPIYAKRFGSVWGDEGARVTLDSDGAIYLAVRYSRSWSFGGPKLPDSKGEFSIGVAKFDPSGTFRWSRGWPNDRSHYPTGLAIDDRGSVWVTGAIRGALDVGTGTLPTAIGGSALVVKLDAESGDTRWARSFGEHTMAAQGVAPDGAGGVLVSGYFKGNVSFGEGVALAAGTGQPFVARLDADGDAEWARAFEGTDDVAMLAVGPSGDPLVLAGGYRGRFDAGTGLLPSAGDADGFVAALLP